MSSEVQSLKTGTVLKSSRREYKILRVLGAGSFGITYLAEGIVQEGNLSFKVKFAIKEHFMSSCYRNKDNDTEVLCTPTSKTEVEQSRKDFVEEAKRLQKVGKFSRNIVSVNETFEANGTAYYVMDYLDGGCLEPVNEDEAVNILCQLADAVGEIHKFQLIHLDIKPDNIIFKRDAIEGSTYPVLIDFGISKHFDKKGKPTSRIYSKGASSGYAPQEQYGEITSFSPQYDIYALGAVLYYLIVGENPPDAFKISPSQKELKDKLENKCSDSVKDAILGAMQPSASERIKSLKEFKAILNDRTEEDKEKEKKKEKRKTEILKHGFTLPEWWKSKIKDVFSGIRPVFSFGKIPSKRIWISGVILLGVISCVWIGLSIGEVSKPEPLSPDEVYNLTSEYKKSLRKDIFNGFYLSPSVISSAAQLEVMEKVWTSPDSLLDEYKKTGFKFDIKNSKGEIIKLPEIENGLDSLVYVKFPFVEYFDDNGRRRVAVLYDDALYYYLGDSGTTPEGKRRHIIADSNNKKGIIDEDGNIIEPVENYIITPVRPNSYAIKKEEGSKYQFYDNAGRKIGMESKYPEDIYISSVGLVSFLNPDYSYSKDKEKLENKYGFKDLNGDLKIPYEFRYPSQFNDEGYAVVTRSNKSLKIASNSLGFKYGVIDTLGKIKIPFDYDYLYFLSPDLLKFTKDGKTGVMKMSNMEIIMDPDYNELLDWGDNFWTKENGKYILINRQGEKILNETFDDAKRSSYQFAKVKNNGKWFLINPQGERISDYYRFEPVFGDGLIRVQKEGKDGFINEGGELMIPFIFDSKNRPSFSSLSHLAPVDFENDTWYINENGALAYPSLRSPIDQAVKKDKENSKVTQTQAKSASPTNKEEDFELKKN